MKNQEFEEYLQKQDPHIQYLWRFDHLADMDRDSIAGVNKF